MPSSLLHVVSISAYFTGAQSAQAVTSQQAEPPPAISLEDLQGEARTVANRVLSRPQSGMVFMEDVKSAIAMWADRLTNLLGPPKQGTVQIIVIIFLSIFEGFSRILVCQFWCVQHENIE